MQAHLSPKRYSIKFLQNIKSNNELIVMKTIRIKLVLFGLLSIWFWGHAQTRYGRGITETLNPLPNCEQLKMETSLSLNGAQVDKKLLPMSVSCDFAGGSIMQALELMLGYNKLGEPFPTLNLQCDFMVPFREQGYNLLTLTTIPTEDLPSVMNLRCDFANFMDPLNIFNRDKPMGMPNLWRAEKE